MARDSKLDHLANVRLFSNLTKRELAAGCESYRYAGTPGELAQLLDADDVVAGVSRVPVRLVAWGTDDDHVRRAYGDFAQHTVRPLWRVVEASSSTAESCPFSVADPAVITAHGVYGWAYAVYPADAAGAAS